MREDALSHTLPQSEFGRQGSNRDFVMYPLRNARKYARNSFPGGTGASDCRSGTKTRNKSKHRILRITEYFFQKPVSAKYCAACVKSLVFASEIRRAVSTLSVLS